ncbi:PRKC apoptosis WT1 regulator protein-like isoform X5 [Periplaneta americana]|uniref:PRKC apoptosis WT1 regulator protein-like isoform X5 n=1 Tax=Periplaneta americana TaxID=6978 RepID=UPI0037E9BD54
MWFEPRTSGIDMASSSVSQEDLENDFELSSRRSRIRTARARTVNPPARIDPGGGDMDDGGGGEMKTSESLNISGNFPAEHDASPKPLSRAKEKRVNRANHMNKGKQQQRDRRKLREKRRSTGVVHLPSTESTGGSTGEDEDETQTAETRRNTQHNEQLLDREPAEDRLPHKTYPQRRNKSPSDLEADDEDNQEFDSLNQSDSTVSSLVHVAEAPCRPRPGTPTGDNPDELLERAQEENRRLLSLLEDRDRKIATLEARISQLQREMSQEKDRLREENAALIRAMASLATAK